MSAADPPLVVLTVGTDAHPFDRVVRWVDDWAAAHPEVRAMAQWGTSAPARHADGGDLLPRSELDELLRAADAVISHGGPATLHQVREAGKLPLCVPRDPALGEHIDDHQQRFARHQAEHGRLVHVGSASQLHELLDRVLDDRRAFVLDPGHDADRIKDAVRRFGAFVDALLDERTDRLHDLHRQALEGWDA